MRILVFIGATAVVTMLAAGGAIVLAVQAEGNDEWMLLSLAATTMFVLAPSALAGVLMFWDVQRSAGTRRAYRRTLLLTIGLQVLATIALSAYVVLTGVAWWVVPLFAACSIGLTAIAVTLGPVVRRMEGPTSLRTAGPVYTRADLRRDLRRIIVTGAVTLVVSAVGTTALILLIDDGGEDAWGLLTFAVLFAVMAAAIACVLVGVRLARQQRDLVDGDIDRLRDLGKAIVRGKTLELSAENAAVAPRFAALSSVAQVYQIAQVLGIMGAFGAMQIIRLVDDPTEVFSWVLAAFFVVLLIALVPVSLVQLRRTRAYALDHGETIIEPRAAATASGS